MTVNAATAAAHESGFPPNVEPWTPGVRFFTFLPINTAPIGTPPAKDFAHVSKSGVTPKCWIANIFPVRPNPDWISSTINNAPRSSQILRAACTYSTFAGYTPPSPCITSKITAAVSFVTALSKASILLYATWQNPGTSGSNPSRYFLLNVADNEP